MEVSEERQNSDIEPGFARIVGKRVLLPINARTRHVEIEKRLLEIADYSETFPFNRIENGSSDLGVVSSGVAYQYARQIFPNASILKLGMPHPLPQRMVREFASSVKKLLVVEELDPFLEESIQIMGIEVEGKNVIPLVGELNPDIVEERSYQANLLSEETLKENVAPVANLPARPPLFCAGCPHTGIFYILSSMSRRSRLADNEMPSIAITGDIGCYTLGTLPPLSAMAH